MIFWLASLNGAPIGYIIQVMLGVFLGVLIGMTVHEFAHNYIAYVMGDNTPREQGRLTLNPLVHIYLPGFLMFVLIGFGILGTAPINARRMRNPRYGYLAAVAAGPVSNLLLAIVFGILVRILGLDSIFGVTLYLMTWMNLVLFLFNFVPLYPLDGWHVVFAALPADLAYKWESTAQYSQMIMLFLIIGSFVLPAQLNPLSILVTGPAQWIMGILIG